MVSARRERILQLVADSYIRTAHPVPSSAVAERLGLSSATVRNEFGTLEEQGFLQQPHASAGRVPTSRGFRAYADRFIPPRPLPARERARLWRQMRGLHGEALLERLARVAAELSGYAVVIELSGGDHVRTLEVHLSLLSNDRLMAVVVLENGMTRQLVVPLAPAPKDEVLDDAERNLRQLTLPVSEVPRALRSIARRVDEELARTLGALADAWPRLTPRPVVTFGLSHLFDEPEASDPEFVRRAVEQLEGGRRGSGDLLAGAEPDEDEVLHLELDEALARVRARLDVHGLRGSLTLVGPTRMRYPVALRIAHGLGTAGSDEPSLDAGRS